MNIYAHWKRKFYSVGFCLWLILFNRKEKIRAEYVMVTACDVSQITRGPWVPFCKFRFRPGWTSPVFLTIWRHTGFVSLYLEEDIELTMFWISGMTLSDIAVLMALFIWLWTMDIIKSFSWDNLRLKSFEKVSKDCLTSFCLSWSFSREKFL